MELTVLGCWAPYPRAGEACSGYLLKTEQTTVLLECGHSVFSTLRKYQDFNELDAVVISHYHPDHFADLYALRHALRGAKILGRRTEPLRLIIPAQPVDVFNYWYSTEEFRVEPIACPIVVKDIRFRFPPAFHTMPGYMVIAEDEKGRRLVYSGDTDYVEEGLAVAQGADILLAEASILERDIEYARKARHLTAREAGRWASMCRVKKLVLTHFWPEYDLKDIEAEARAEYSGEIELAREGLTVKVARD